MTLSEYMNDPARRQAAKEFWEELKELERKGVIPGPVAIPPARTNEL